jgi:hypothetical protein
MTEEKLCIDFTVTLGQGPHLSQKERTGKRRRGLSKIIDRVKVWECTQHVIFLILYTTFASASSSLIAKYSGLQDLLYVSAASACGIGSKFMNVLNF